MDHEKITKMGLGSRHYSQKERIKLPKKKKKKTKNYAIIIQ